MSKNGITKVTLERLGQLILNHPFIRLENLNFHEARFVHEMVQLYEVKCRANLLLRTIKVNQEDVYIIINHKFVKNEHEETYEPRTICFDIGNHQALASYEEDYVWVTGELYP